MAVKVGINGFGRIGRQAFKGMVHKYGDEIDVVGINDLYPPSTFSLLLRYDTAYGRFEGTVEETENSLIVNGKEVKFYSERNPADIPWGEMGADIVLESTGAFRDAEDAAAHLEGGAKKVVISAPATNEDITIVLGVNEQDYDPANHDIVSNASCTTNCLAPAAKVVHDNWGIVKGLMTTIHSYTSTQRLQDMPHRKPTRGRAAAENIIPTTTGAAQAVSLVLPELEGKFDGMAMRVPTLTVSVVDFVAETAESLSDEELIAAFDEAAEGSMKGILGVNKEPLVSMDFKADPRSSIIDVDSCQVLGGNMVKVVTWYDNEWAYAMRCADLMVYMAKQGL